ncbi:nucleoside deaminase [Candidatus Kirkpatrickella diaphorinae]|uniref:tRNA-specific adenosine deaminase n=1 Tax=Candidatus Kirkpatrickella diaphorinae TaxID=2984322 RepID=A0ABY6GL75_9PROT|nr:nucleoside deaminase [Candidatus Kirkpatrickella diaphorinae]UYH52308.1 nucleoside deaminase [Candidatus Kirkpatrickella diaphorinae]
MELALTLAREAGASGEVPVGAVILDAEGRLCAAQANQVESDSDPSAHAELRAMRAAARHCGTKYLSGCTLYVTLEPCPMCAASMVHFKLSRLIFGAYDPKGGGVEHGPRIFEQKKCLHRPDVIGGIRAEESAALLRGFFSRLRAEKGAEKP